jgi:hypothetical protein
MIQRASKLPFAVGINSVGMPLFIDSRDVFKAVFVKNNVGAGLVPAQSDECR